MEKRGWEAVEDEVVALELKVRRSGAFTVTVSGDDVRVEEVLDPNAFVQRLLADDLRILLYVYLHPRSSLAGIYQGVELDRAHVRHLMRRLSPLLLEEDGAYSLDQGVLEGTELWNLLHTLELYYLEVRKRFRVRKLHETRGDGSPQRPRGAREATPHR